MENYLGSIDIVEFLVSCSIFFAVMRGFTFLSQPRRFHSIFLFLSPAAKTVFRDSYKQDIRLLTEKRQNWTQYTVATRVAQKEDNAGKCKVVAARHTYSTKHTNILELRLFLFSFFFGQNTLHHFGLTQHRGPNKTKPTTTGSVFRFSK